eukprot:639318-Amphidinium_carterae.1
MDALNMSQWYPHCGEDYEKEHACAIAAVRVVDDKCREQLDEAYSEIAIEMMSILLCRFCCYV